MIKKIFLIFILLVGFSFGEDNCSVITKYTGFVYSEGLYPSCSEIKKYGGVGVEVVYFLDKEEIIAVLPFLKNDFNFMIDNSSRSIYKAEKGEGAIASQWNGLGSKILNNGSVILVLAYEEIFAGMSILENPKKFRLIFEFYPKGF